MSEPQLIFAAMSRVMGDVGHIAKNRKNTSQGYAFRGIDDIYAALQGPLVKHGVFCVPQVIESTVVERQTKNGGTLIYTTLKVAHRFFASDGSSVEAVTIGEAMDSGDKSSNKAMSAAIKYAFLEVFCIPTEGDNDSEGQTHEVAPFHGPTSGKAVAALAQHAPAPRQESSQPISSARTAESLSVTGTTSTQMPPTLGGTKSFKDRYADVCECLEQRLGTKAADDYIEIIKKKHGGSKGTTAQKEACVLELEALVRGEDIEDDLTAMHEGEAP